MIVTPNLVCIYIARLQIRTEHHIDSLYFVQCHSDFSNFHLLLLKKPIGLTESNFIWHLYWSSKMVCSNPSGHVTKMATAPIIDNGITPSPLPYKKINKSNKNIQTPLPGSMKFKLLCKIYKSCPINCMLLMTLRCCPTFARQNRICLFVLLYGNAETSKFS